MQRLLQHPDSLKTLPALLEENTRRLQVRACTSLVCTALSSAAMVLPHKQWMQA